MKKADFKMLTENWTSWVQKPGLITEEPEEPEETQEAEVSEEEQALIKADEIAAAAYDKLLDSLPARWEDADWSNSADVIIALEKSEPVHMEQLQRALSILVRYYLLMLEYHMDECSERGGCNSAEVSRISEWWSGRGDTLSAGDHFAGPRSGDAVHGWRYLQKSLKEERNGQTMDDFPELADIWNTVIPKYRDWLKSQPGRDKEKKAAGAVGQKKAEKAADTQGDQGPAVQFPSADTQVTGMVKQLQDYLVTAGFAPGRQRDGSAFADSVFGGQTAAAIRNAYHGRKVKQAKPPANKAKETEKEEGA